MDYLKLQMEEVSRDLAAAVDEADTGGPQSDKRLMIAIGKAALAILWALQENN